MSDLGSALKNEPSYEENYKRLELKKRITDTYTEEIIIGLCGPIGTDIHFVADTIKEIMQDKYGYVIEIIKLSEFIKKHTNFNDLDNSSKFNYHTNLITCGNDFRSNKGNSILAELAINEIAVKREEVKLKTPEFGYKSNRICYIIDSIKNNAELELFRLIYSNLFYFIGVFSNLELREKRLEKSGIKKEEVFRLIDRDSGEEIVNGQKVSDTFVESDYFLRLDNVSSNIVTHKISRFLNLIFSSEVITPTKYETAMYQAHAAAGNSACLSRQVGASITNEKGEIISLGWNDVPKFQGGVYNYGESDELGKQDFRCINMEGGVCFNDSEKVLIREGLLNELVDKKVISPENFEKALLIIQKSRIKELIEFSRAVHAEMLAIIQGSQNSGTQVINGSLFCTTYPCHNCARHIVAAGIKEVYYIEPYRKSLALKLHSDSITENENDESKVRILMFDGVSPRRYLDLFRMVPNSRKNSDGKKNKPNKKTIHPKKTFTLQAIPILEKEVVKELEAKSLITL